MTNNNAKKPHSKNHKLMLESTAVIVLLVASASLPNIQSAFAVTDIMHYYGINCANNYWGAKNYQNTYSPSSNDIIYGTNTSCGNVAALDGRYNYAQLTTHNTPKSSDDIAWEATFQGVDPWGTAAYVSNCSMVTCALNNNTNFNGLNPVQATHYNLDVQYDWESNLYSVPNTGAANGDVQANVLTDIWFKSKDGTKALVIDFGYQHLTNQNGQWVDRKVTDKDTSTYAPGKQYYVPFWDTSGGKTTFHYNVVLDTTNRTADTWVAPGALDIQTYINDAFLYTYNDINGLNAKTTGGSSNYYIVDVESGAEIWARGNSNLHNYGTIQAGFSKTELYY